MNNLVIQNNELQVLQTIATNAAKSGLYGGVGGQEKILMILLAANDLGIKPTIALNGGIWNIQGKIEISARLMTSMIRRAGHSLKVKMSNETVCTIYGKRSDNGDEDEITFDIEQAKKAGLVRQNRDGSPGIWMKYPIDMLYARAMSRLARRLFPDVIGTAYVEGEIRDGDVIDITPNEEKTTKKQKEVEYSPVINEEQVNQLNALKELCDPAYIEKLMSYLSTMHIMSFSEIKEVDFKKILTGMSKNAEIFNKGNEEKS